MQKLTCTLEFKDDRPMAREINLLARPNERNYIGFDTNDYFRDLNNFLKAENSRREFEIEIKEPFVKYGKSIYIVNGGNSTTIGMHRFISEGDRFTATIENNIVTKIEIL